MAYTKFKAEITAENKVGGASKVSSESNSGFFRRVTAMLIALVIVFAATVTTATANPNPPPDCPQTPFIGPVWSTMMTADSCIVTYEFWYRYACGIWYDTYIGEIRISGPAHCTADDRMIDAIQAEIVKNWSDEGLPEVPSPRIPNCDEGDHSPTQWRFFRPQCQGEAFDFVDGRPITVIVACPTGSYCVKLYRYCWEIRDGVRVLRAIQTGSLTFGPQRCVPTIYIPLDPERPPQNINCTPICN